MPIRVGGRRLGPQADQLLDWLAILWVEATEEGKIGQALRAKVARQEAWLEGNRDDPRYPARAMQAVVTRQELTRQEVRVHELAARANELADLMDAATREQAKQSIHEWSVIGSPGVYAIAWNLVPDPAWLQMAGDRR